MRHTSVAKAVTLLSYEVHWLVLVSKKVVTTWALCTWPMLWPMEFSSQPRFWTKFFTGAGWGRAPYFFNTGAGAESDLNRFTYNGAGSGFVEKYRCLTGVGAGPEHQSGPNVSTKYSIAKSTSARSDNLSEQMLGWHSARSQLGTVSKNHSLFIRMILA